MLKITAQAHVAGLEKFVNGLQSELDAGVDETTVAIANTAKRNALPYRRTGAEAEGYYVVTPVRGSTYVRAVAAARAQNPKVNTIPEQAPPSKSAGMVGNVVDYNLVNELGSPARNRPAKAMLRRAIEAERREYPARIQRRLRRLAGG